MIKDGILVAAAQRGHPKVRIVDGEAMRAVKLPGGQKKVRKARILRWPR